jgi:hypothetical protein
MPSDGAVVVTVTVTVVGELLRVTDAGETVQLACEGAPVQVKVTFPFSPPWPAMLNV